MLILLQIFLKNAAKLFLTAWPYVQDKATDSSANIAFLKRAKSKLFHGVLQCLDHLAVGDALWAGEHYHIEAL